MHPFGHAERLSQPVSGHVILVYLSARRWHKLPHSLPNKVSARLFSEAMRLSVDSYPYVTDFAVSFCAVGKCFSPVLPQGR